jgi:hypothetical protein
MIGGAFVVALEPVAAGALDLPCSAELGAD